MFDKNIILAILGFIATILFSASFNPDLVEGFSTGLSAGFDTKEIPVIVSCSDPTKTYPITTSFKNMSTFGNLQSESAKEPVPTVSYPAYQQTAANQTKFSPGGMPAEVKLRPAAMANQGFNTNSVKLSAANSGPPVYAKPEQAPLKLSNLTMLGNEGFTRHGRAEYFESTAAPTMAPVSNSQVRDKLNPTENDYLSMVDNLKKDQMGVIKPPVCMDVVLDDGTKDQVYITNRYMFANKRDRLNSAGARDFIRGDILVVPDSNTGWFTTRGQFNPSTVLQTGAVLVTNGFKNESALKVQALKNMYNKGGTYGGVSLSDDAQNQIQSQFGLTQNVQAAREASAGDIQHAMSTGNGGRRAMAAKMALDEVA